MTVRTNATDVKAILDNSQLTSTQIDGFITTANLFVTEILGGNTVLSSDMMAEIEKYITAHFISVTIERTGKQEKVGEAQITYNGQWDKGLQSTSYGQIALNLDVTGALANSGKKAISFTAITSFD